MQPKVIYGIFQRRADNSIWGYVENSFSMSWEKERVRVWRGKNGPEVFKLHFVAKRFKNLSADGEVFLVRLNSKKSPVELDNWNPMGKDFSAPKTMWRNAKFKVK